MRKYSNIYTFFQSYFWRREHKAFRNYKKILCKINKLELNRKVKGQESGTKTTSPVMSHIIPKA